MMFLYLLKSTACLALFLLFYWAMLENARMHSFKRFYLLVALVLSLLVPLITFTTYVEIEPVNYAFDTTYGYNTIALPEETAIDYWPYILWSVYGLGVLLFTIKFILNLLTLSKNISKNTKFKMGSIINVLVKHQVAPHTFFNYIFLNRRKFQNNEIPKEVLLHEIAHASQKHSIDIILVELLQIIFWFNPLFYMTKRAMKLNHEFLADQAVINAGIATSRYQSTLLDFASSARTNKYQPSMANAIDFSFYSSIHLALFGKLFPFRRTVAGQVKKRFTVMKTKTSKKSIVLRSTLIIPLMASMVYGFSKTKYVPLEPASAVIEINPSLEFPLGTYPEKIKQSKPTQKDFKAWTDSNEYAIWIHEKHVENSALDHYRPSDFAHYFLSYVYENARSESFPQPYQLHLYTPEEFDRYFIYDDNLITIHVNRDGNLLVQNEIVTLESLASFLKQLHNDLSKEERASSVRIIIKPHDIAPRSTLLKKIEAILENYGVAQIDILGRDTQTYRTTLSQRVATPEQIKAYNTLAKKYNAMPKTKRIIPSDDLKSLEKVYRKMSESQKNEAQPFPECSDPKANIKEGATEKQVAEYNALAKKYNAMLEGDEIRIMKSDIERLEYLHGLMTEDQRANAEPFPDFPEPPEPPTPPVPPVQEDIEIEEIIEIPEHETIEVEEEVEVEEDVDEIIEIPKNEALREEVIHEIVENQEIYDYLEKEKMVAMSEHHSSFIPNEGKQTRKMMSRYDVDTEEIKSKRQENIPPPLPPYKIPEPRKNYSKALLKAFDDFNSSGQAYGKAISQFMKNNKGKRSDLWVMHDQVIEKYNRYVTLAVEEGLMPPRPKKSFRSVRRPPNTVPPPPPAPEPKSPLQHIDEMAERGALFYYEGKAIDAKEAKEILRKSKNININTRHEKGQKPVIKLSTTQ
ncbi:M56 family metallopeptidase [Pareuzebyella sediminis]|uniref:M56 family metallopeptidase n=1 Tax=Pareuzebyella sediminis TaxID=2607998 RepID=UPI0011ECC9BF|nr:M56 family metallopeptidase [Pareuzebyella sediminis]